MLEILHSDDDTFFGGDVSSDSSSFSEVPDETDEPSAKVPRLADDWSESEVEDESEPDDGDDVREQNDGAEESTAEMTVADIERAFHFSSEFPGKVKMSKTHCSDEVTTLQLVKDPEKVFPADDLPPLLAPAGLSDHRRKYLQDNVLQFCRIENRPAFSALLA